MSQWNFSRVVEVTGVGKRLVLAASCAVAIGLGLGGMTTRSASGQAAPGPTSRQSVVPETATTQPGDDAVRPPLGEIEIGDYCTILLATKLQSHLNCSDDQRQKFVDLRRLLNGALDNAAGGRFPGGITPGAVASRGHAALDNVGKQVRDALSPSQDAALVAMFESQELLDVGVDAAVAQTGNGGPAGPTAPTVPMRPQPPGLQRGPILPRGPMMPQIPRPQPPAAAGGNGGGYVAAITVIYTHWGEETGTPLTPKPKTGGTLLPPAQANGQPVPAPILPGPVPPSPGDAPTPIAPTPAPAAQGTIPWDVYSALTPAQQAEIPPQLRPTKPSAASTTPPAGAGISPSHSGTGVTAATPNLPPPSGRAPAQINSLADAIACLNSTLASAQLRGAQWLDTAAPVAAQRATVLALLKPHIMEPDGKTRLAYVVAFANWSEAAQKDDLVAIVAFPETIQGISNQEANWAAAIGALVRIDPATAATAMDSRHTAFFFKGEMQKVLQVLAEVSGPQRIPASQLLNTLLNSDPRAKIKTVADAEKMLAGSVPSQQVDAAKWLASCELTPNDQDQVTSLLRPHLQEPDGHVREPFVHAFAYWAEAANVDDLVGVVDTPDTVTGISGHEDCWADAVIGLLRLNPDAALKATNKRVSVFFFRAKLSSLLTPIATGISDETIYARQLKAVADNTH